MSVLIRTQKVTDVKHLVISQNFQHEILSDEDKVGGIEVASIPHPDTPMGYYEQLYFNPSTKELWYEYTMLPRPKEELQTEKIIELQKQVNNLNIALAQLMGV